MRISHMGTRTSRKRGCVAHGGRTDGIWGQQVRETQNVFLFIPCLFTNYYVLGIELAR